MSRRPAADPRLPVLPADLVLRTPRLRLEPVRAADAAEVEALVGDPDLWSHVDPPRHLATGTRAWLEQQERRRAPTGSALWLTWLVRPAAGGAGVGQVQATVVAGDDGPQAELSWLVARACQRRGYATEATRAVAAWLGDRLGVRRLHAHVPDGHTASEAVARRVGLVPSPGLLDGERRWSAALPPRP